MIVRETTDVADFKFIQSLVEFARSSGEPWAASWTSSVLTDELKTARVFVARANASTETAFLGFIFVRPPGAAWEITLTAVSPNARKMGVFSALFTEVLEAIGRVAASSECHLEVRADNRAAIVAYESRGFKAVGRRPRYYADGTDAILYKRD